MGVLLRVIFPKQMEKPETIKSKAMKKTADHSDRFQARLYSNKQSVSEEDGEIRVREAGASG